jgi:hypothetical protein
MTWHAFGDGTSTGTKGSEGGTIALDEEHPDGARITLEQGGHTAPWAITCGVYGLMVHTRFFADRPRAETEYEAMKPALHAVVSQLGAADLAEQGRLAPQLRGSVPDIVPQPRPARPRHDTEHVRNYHARFRRLNLSDRQNVVYAAAGRAMIPKRRKMACISARTAS